MDAFSPSTTYFVGLGSLGLALHAFLRPRDEYPRFGLPLAPARDANTKAGPAGQVPAPGPVSPFIYVKGLRELSYGLLLIALQRQGDVAGVTTVLGVAAAVALGDGLVVWFHGGGELRHRAAGHWGGCLLLGSWAAWRAFRSYGEGAAFHALGR